MIQIASLTLLACFISCSNVLPQRFHCPGTVFQGSYFRFVECRVGIVCCICTPANQQIHFSLSTPRRPFCRQQYPSSDIIDAAITSSLTRFHLIQCYSSFEFLASLKTLPTWLNQLTSSPAPDGNNNNQILGAILIDNIAAYYYPDRSCRAPTSISSSTPMPATAAGAMGGVNTNINTNSPFVLSLQRVHLAMAAALQKVQKAYKVPIIATKNALLGKSLKIAV